MPGSGAESWTLLGDDGAVVEPVERYLAYLAAIERSPNTVRAYAVSLKLWFEFLAWAKVDWAEVGIEDVARLRAPAPNVVVLADGAVEKRSFDLSADADDELVGRAGAHLAAHAQGVPLPGLAPPPATGDHAVDAVVDAASAALSELASSGEADHVFVGGPSRLAGAFEAVETVRSVLAILEQQLVVVSLLRDVLDRGLSVAIGAEHGFEPLASCAVVVAPVWVDGHDAGAVGLLGPTRMNYPQALAAAHMVGERLGERLGGTLGAMSAAPPDAGDPGDRRRRGGRRGGG